MSALRSIKSLLKQTSEKLSHVSDSAYLDAELLLAHAIEKNRSYLHTWPEQELTSSQLEFFDSLIEKRLSDYPVAYLLGKKAFWTFDLKVTSDVLIPRPETELLVEVALEKIKSIKNPQILDLGTGSGAIALALLSERPDASVIATDSSKEALAIAQFNATELKLDKQVSFIESNWSDNINVADDYFDLIVSNPPYIDQDDVHLLGSIKYEPQKALLADDDGMSDLEKIIQKSHPFLIKSGWLIVEHGFDQADKVRRLLDINDYSKSNSYLDLNNIYRITLGQKI